MIGKLFGKIDTILEDCIIIMVNNVGYRVFCSSKILSTLNVGDEIALIILTSVKEDSITLYGFLSELEKKWFEVLCKINGVGNKMALKIMSALSIDDIIVAINSDDTKIFSKISGIGPKIASRVLLELKGISKNNNIINTSMNNISIKNKTINQNDNDNRLKDALSALENLGYQRNISYNILISILNERKDIVIESLITEALKRINKF